ncbi:sensor histidine kinase [Tomitella biformata]|uniref:sensor histidine kinase n=1 Tax=Tomitella biformata TaxID=630403 RepID=UPI0004668873|nr:histidine kinase [Tomitella biformata]
MSTRYTSALIALGYFAGGALLYLLDLSALVSGYSDVGWWPRLVVLAAICCAILLRRSHPLLGLILGTIPLVVDAALGPSVSAWLAYGDLLYAAVLGGTPLVRRVLERGGVTVVAAVAVWAAIDMADVAAGVLVAGVGTLLVLTPIWWAGSLRTQRDAADAERVKFAALARVAELDQVAAVGSERQRLARDLHDVIAGHLSAIAIQSEAALRLGDKDPARAIAVLASVRANSVEALGEMQTMIGLLQSESDAPTTAGRLGDIAVLVDSARASGSPVAVVGAPPQGLDTDTDLTGYRIVQEILTNATRHASGRDVELRFSAAVDELVITSQNALGDRPHPGTGHGLRNIRERALAVGGRASWQASDGQWTIEAALPIAGAR